MSWKDQTRRRRQAERRGARGTRRAVAEALRMAWGPAGRGVSEQQGPGDDDGIADCIS